MCTTRGERKLFSSIRCQKECVEYKLEGHMESYSNYSAHLRVMQEFDTKSVLRGGPKSLSLTV